MAGENQATSDYSRNEDPAKKAGRKRHRDRRSRFKVHGGLFNGLNPIPTDFSVDPAPFLCFNCWGDGHMFKDCPLPRFGRFCRNCGRKEVTIRDCPRCGEVYRAWVEAGEPKKTSVHLSDETKNCANRQEEGAYRAKSQEPEERKVPKPRESAAKTEFIPAWNDERNEAVPAHNAKEAQLPEECCAFRDTVGALLRLVLSVSHLSVGAQELILRQMIHEREAFFKKEEPFQPIKSNSVPANNTDDENWDDWDEKPVQSSKFGRVPAKKAYHKNWDKKPSQPIKFGSVPVNKAWDKNRDKKPFQPIKFGSVPAKEAYDENWDVWDDKPAQPIKSGRLGGKKSYDENWDVWDDKPAQPIKCGRVGGKKSYDENWDVWDEEPGQPDLIKFDSVPVKETYEDNWDDEEW